MGNNALLILLLLAGLSACSEAKKYRDTTALETPPRLAISEESSGEEAKVEQQGAEKSLADSVFLDDAENPTVLKIKKLLDRSWDIVGQALDKKKTEITDKNREEGVYYVKYDPSADAGTRLFGNVRLFIFEEEYREAEYKLSLVWRETETEVRAEMIAKPNVGEVDEEALADGSAKLLKALFQTIVGERVE